MRLLTNLLPLLKQSVQPKVLNVLNGGKESPIFEDDLGLKHKWSPIQVVTHSTTMTSLLFDHLAAENPGVAFIHAQPGWVHTENFTRLSDAQQGPVWRLAVACIQGLAGALVGLFGVSAKESGERQAFHLASGLFGPGAWRVDYQSEDVAPNGFMKGARQNLLPLKIWSHTKEAFEEVVGKHRLS